MTRYCAFLLTAAVLVGTVPQTGWTTAAAPPAAGDPATASPQPDWISRVPRNLSSAPVRPADGASVLQTPPDFSWPSRGRDSDSEYSLTLTYPDGIERSRRTRQNWMNWDEILPAGRYSWQVEIRHKGRTETSRARHFTVADCAEPFLLPPADELLRRARSGARPRSLPPAGTFHVMLDERRTAVRRLSRRVNAVASEQLPPDPPAGPVSAVEAVVFPEIRRTLDALFAYAASASERHYEDSLRRALNLASWNPQGSTSYAAADQAARGVATALTFAYDWLSTRLSKDEKGQLLEALRPRMQEMYDDLVASGQLASHPFNSHGNHTLAYLAALSAVLAGDLPEADEWLRNTVPLAVNWSSPWGGDDGGFANGTAYAQWVVGDMLFAWNVLRLTMDVDLSRKAWQRNHSYYLAYFLPPGTPHGVFGDAAERRLTEQWGRFGLAMALFAPSPVARWRISKLEGGDSSLLHSLLSPLPSAGPVAEPAALPNAAYFPSIGWTAMHSDLGDPGRRSIYFKSSPFGSFNHSHADQNSFVIDSGGEALAIDSGYYDSYASEHWKHWYKQTKAHNAITFDGGQGQSVFEQNGELGAGEIRRFERHAGYDLVIGDASAAYGESVEQALRTLVYLRPDFVVVYDHLVAPVGRRWEWNIHARERMEPRGDSGIVIRSGDESLCVDMLVAPAVTFEQSDRFTPPPEGRDRPAQWHGAFVTGEPVAKAEFVALLGVGCPEAGAELTQEGERRELRIGEHKLALENGRVEVTPLPGEGDGSGAPHPGLSCTED